MYEAPREHPIHDYKQSIVTAAIKEMRDRDFLNGPLKAEFTFVFSRPSAMTWKKKPMPRVWHSKRSDIDNNMKAIFDAMNGIVYPDDALICEVSGYKCIASGNEEPHTNITITEIDHEVPFA